MNQIQCCKSIYSIKHPCEITCSDTGSGNQDFCANLKQIYKFGTPIAEKIKFKEECCLEPGKTTKIRPQFKFLPNFTACGRQGLKPTNICCKSKRRKTPKCERVNMKTRHVLEGPIGFAFGTLNINDFLNQELDNCLLLQGYATCLIAFGEIYLTPETEWTHHILNGVLHEGAKLVENSLRGFQGDASEVNVVSKCFTLRRNGMEVCVSEPVIVGMMECPNPRVYSFGVAIAMFLRKFQYCLARVEDRFYLIWKTKQSYFLFDCYGRTATAKSDFEKGEVALICVGSTKKIDVLLTCMGKVSPDSIYTLYEVRMLRLMQGCDQPFMCSGRPRQPNYELISSEHARLQGTIHLATDCFKGSRYKQAVAMGLVSIVYSKIDAPCTWDSVIVDKVLMVGNRCYSEWTDFDTERCLCIQDIPRRFLVGQFLAEIVVLPALSCGNWINLPDYRVCEITRAIKDAFQERWCLNILVQVDRKTYAIWKRSDFYYLFDPYPMELVQAAHGDSSKNATLHMFSTLKLLCCELTQHVIGLSIPCKFIIHAVKILKLSKINGQRMSNELALPCVDPVARMDVEETESLNESICDNRCEEALVCAKEQYDIGYCDLDLPPLSEIQNFETETIKTVSSTSEEDLTADEEELQEEIEEEDMEKQSEEELMEEQKKPKKPAKTKQPKKSKEPKTSKESKRNKSKESRDSEDSEEGKKGKDIAKAKRHGKTKGKRQDEGDANVNSDNESESSPVDDNKSIKSKDKKGGKGKDKKITYKEKGKVKNQGNTSDEGTFEDDNKSETGKIKNKDKSKKSKKEKANEKNIKDKGRDKEEKEKKNKEKGKKKEKRKEKDKEDKDDDKKSKKKEQAKEKEKKIGKTKVIEKGNGTSTEEDDGDKKSDKKKDQDEVENKAEGKNKKAMKDNEKDKSGESDASSGETTSTVSGVSTISKSSKSSLSSASKVMEEDEPETVQQQYGKYGICPPDIEPKGGWPKGSGCLPKSYPGYSHVARNLAVVGSEAGTYQSICQLISSAFQVADRILTMTAWGNYVVFKNMASYLLYDGCTCNPCRFRNIDLSIGTAGLLCFDNLHDLIIEIMNGKNRSLIEQTKPLTADDICKEYC